MEAMAKTTIRQSAKKVRFVLNEIRSLNVNDALARLRFMNKKAAKAIYHTLMSAINNMQQAELEFNEESSEMNDSVFSLIIILLIIIIIVLFMIFLRKKLR